MIHIKNISKTYKSVKALSDISFDVKEGEVFGLIGPDGAGKTTLFRILATLIIADSGNAEIFGNDVVKDYRILRNKIGYMPGRFSLYQDMSVEENIRFYASVFGTTLEENYDLIKDIYTQLEPFKKRRAGKLSGGMKQKLALCCTLIHRPKLLILDEPTTGVDPVSRNEFWDILLSLKEWGITVIVSTPYMDEASRCNRIAMINSGSIMAIDTPQRIIDSYTDNLWQIKGGDMYSLLLALKEIPNVSLCYPFGEYHHIILSEKEDNMQNVISGLNIHDIEYKRIKPTVEDCYIKLSMQ